MFLGIPMLRPRWWKLVAVLFAFAGAAEAQTYVRPSKGKSFNPFATDPAVVSGCGNPGGAFPPWPSFPTWTNNTPNSPNINACSQVYDWTAFAGLEVYLYTVPSVTCPGNVRLTKYQVPHVGSYVRFQINNAQNGSVPAGTNVSGQLNFVVTDAPVPEGPFSVANSDLAVGNNSSDFGVFNHGSWPSTQEIIDGLGIIFGGCDVQISIVPIPFRSNRSVVLDGANTPIPVNAFTQPPRCGQLREYIDTMNGTSTAKTVFAFTTSLSEAVDVCNQDFNPYDVIRCATFDTETLLYGGGQAIPTGSCKTFTNSKNSTQTGVHCVGSVGTVVRIAKCEDTGWVGP